MSDRASVLCPTQDKLGYLEGVSVMYATVQTAIHTEVLGPLPSIPTACVQAFGEAGRAAEHGICHTNYSRWRKPPDGELSFGEYSLRLITPDCNVMECGCCISPPSRSHTRSQRRISWESTSLSSHTIPPASVGHQHIILWSCVES
jgi:hypothetical protein